VKRASTIVLAAVLLAAGAAAHPTVGAHAPRAQFADADGRAFVLRMPPGRPVLVLYEDKSSAAQNAAFKEELGKLAADGRYRAAVDLVPVADVSGYDFWPVRGFVASAIRDESRRWGTTIFCDWSGGFRSAFDLRRGVSNVLLIGRDGSILFAKEGALDVAERGRLLAMLRGEVAHDALHPAP
jgi:hypothetical protein